MKIAFVGLGAMGAAMVKHILKAGYEVYGFDHNQERVQALHSEGLKTCTHLLDIAPELDILIIMVVEAHQVESILNDNIITKLKKNCIIISTSTLPPTYIKELALKLKKFGVGLLDSPVSGGHKGAQNGTLTLMLSGDSQDIEKCQKVLETFSSLIYRVGNECGMGSTLKVIHQHLASTHIALTVEALGLCKKAGLDPSYFLEVVKNSAGTSKIFETFAPLLIEKDYTPHSSVNVTEKDLRLVVELAKSLDYQAPIVEEAYKMYLKSQQEGLGELSPVAAIKLLNVEW
ncbi:MAG: NAD(P)-dependent oxidoreductase [Brevinema sp.]